MENERVSEKRLPELRMTNEKKSITTTFRLDADLIRQLKNRAEHNEITLNTLVNHALKRYVEWDMFIEDRVGIIPLSGPVARELFEGMDRDTVARLALSTGKGAVMDLILSMGCDIDSGSVITWFLSRMRNSSAYVSSKRTNDGSQIHVIKHDMGENWSLYHKAVVESIYEEMQKPIHITATKSSLILEIKE